MNTDIQKAAAALVKKHGSRCIEIAVRRFDRPTVENPQWVHDIWNEVYVECNQNRCEANHIFLLAALLAAREDERERIARDASILSPPEWINGSQCNCCNPATPEEIPKPDPNATKDFIQGIQAAQKATREHSIHFGEEQDNER